MNDTLMKLGLLKTPELTHHTGGYRLPRSEFLLVVLVSVILIPTGALWAQDKLEPLERIRIKPGQELAEFVFEQSGKPFFVKGFNYVRLRGDDHATFDADTETTKAHYDPNAAEEMFKLLSNSGYNAVRVFIIGRSETNPGIGGNYATTKAVYEPYMENFVDFLRRATRYNIRVFPSIGDGELPLNAYYYERGIQGGGHNKNALVLTKEGIDARIEFVTSFISYIKSKEPALLATLLGLQCQNEACLHADQWPFTKTSGTFSAANGKAYDLSKTDERQALMDEGYRYYHERIVEAVKGIDARMLVAEGVFVPRAVGKEPSHHAGLWPGKMPDDRYPPMLTSLGRGKLDFLDVHFYRTNPNETVDQAFRLNLESTGFFTVEMSEFRKEKPVIMGEFGAFDFVEKTFEEAVDNMVRVRDLALTNRLNGMLYWTYDCFEQPKLYHAAADWALFRRKMGGYVNHPGPGPSER